MAALDTAKGAGGGFPQHISVTLTNRCNLLCDMCQMPLHRTAEAPIERLAAFLARLAAWLPPGRLILFTGGEPLLLPQLGRYVRAVAEHGVMPAINTNGSLLTIERLDELICAGLQMVNLSIDGLGETHDRLRRGPGLFQGLLDIIHYLTQHTSLLVNVISVIHAQNAPELPELVELLCRQPRFGAFNFQAIVPTVAKPWSDEFFAQDPLWPRTEPELTRVLTALDRLEQLQRDGRPINNPPAQFAYWRRYFRDPRHFASREPCLVGDEAFNVGVTGEVTLCHHLGRLGMIDDDPRTLWESPDAAAMRAAMRACPRACNYRVNCCYVDDAAEPASLGGT